MRARSKFLSISIIFLIFISFSLNFAQAQQSQKKAERKNMMRAFLEKHNFNLKIVWNKFTATPEVIYGNRISGYSGTPRQIATGFLRNEKGMLGIEDVNQNLSLERTEFSDNCANRWQNCFQSIEEANFAKVTQESKLQMKVD